MDYSKYKQSRDLAWQVLIDNNISELPVKVSNICKALKIILINHEDGKGIIDRFDLSSHTINNDGFTYKNVIFYNNKCTIPRQRFTVGHELGHILLHTKGIYNREPSTNDSPIEQEANVFASRLLAPACVLWGLGITTAEQIAQFCDISITAAQFRKERLDLLYQRNKFLISPLERQVYTQFKDYININKL